MMDEEGGEGEKWRKRGKSKGGGRVGGECIQGGEGEGDGRVAGKKKMNQEARGNGSSMRRVCVFGRVGGTGPEGKCHPPLRS